MAAGGGQSPGRGRQKQTWLARKLDIEVGKVQAKLKSKGISVPQHDNVDAAAINLGPLPRFELDLHGRNPDGTIPLEALRRPKPPSTAGNVVKRLDEAMDPTALQPIPPEFAARFGLLPDVASAGRLEAPGSPSRDSQRLQAANATAAAACSRLGSVGSAGQGGGGGSGAGAVGVVSVPGAGEASAPHPASPKVAMHHQQQQPPPPHGSHHHHHHHHHHALGDHLGAPGSPEAWHGVAVAMAAEAAPPSPGQHHARSPLHGGRDVRPDLLGVDYRIEGAVAEAQRLGLKAGELTPRERVLVLAKAANPGYDVPHPRQVRALAAAAAAAAAAAQEGLQRHRSQVRRNISRRNIGLAKDAQGQPRAASIAGAGSQRQGSSTGGQRPTQDSSLAASSDAGLGAAPVSGSGQAAEHSGALPQLAESDAKARHGPAGEDQAGREGAAAKGDSSGSGAAGEGLPPLSPSRAPQCAELPDSGPPGSSSRVPGSLPPLGRRGHGAPAGQEHPLEGHEAEDAVFEAAGLGPGSAADLSRSESPAAPQRPSVPRLPLEKAMTPPVGGAAGCGAGQGALAGPPLPAFCQGVPLSPPSSRRSARFPMPQDPALKPSDMESSGSLRRMLRMTGDDTPATRLGTPRRESGTGDTGRLTSPGRLASPGRMGSPGRLGRPPPDGGGAQSARAFLSPVPEASAAAGV